MAGLLLLLLCLVLLALRQNLIIILAAAVAYCYAVFGDGDLRGIVLDSWDTLNKDVLLSIPLYILAGNLMSRGAMAARLVRVMRALSGSIPGGLGIATVLSCALFAAVSGSGTVTLLAVGSVMYPALLQAGYSRRYAIGALCAAGTLGILIPPSIPLILYGVMTQTSITDLFLAGILPGLLLTAIFAVYSGIHNRHLRGDPFDARELWAALRDGFFALLMPVIILGGIYSGHFTATESAAVALAYALLVEMLIYRQLKWRQLYAVSVDTAQNLGALFPVLMMAFALNMYLTYERLPEVFVSSMQQWIDSPTVFLLLTNAFLLLLGCVMDIGSAILIMAPLLEPLANAQGINSVHFGIIMVMNLEIGYLTPPLGLNLIVAMGAFRESFAEICKAVVPFVLLMLLGLLVVTFYPPIALALVK